MNISPPRSTSRPTSPSAGSDRMPGRLRPLSVLAMLAGWPRRLLAVLLLLLAAVVWLHERGGSAGAADGRVPVLAAAHDLGAGAVVTASDVRLVRFDPDLVPVGTLRTPRSALGRTVAGAVRRGEPITDVRLAGPGLTVGLHGPDTVAVPVRLADGDTAALLRPGDRVDLLAAPADGPGRPAGSVQMQAAGQAEDAAAVAVGVRVLAVLARPDSATEDGAVVVVATSDAAARRLAGTAAQARLSVALRPP